MSTTPITALPETPIATCIGCGCDDLHACVDLFGDPCHWLTVSYEDGTGVCSACPDHIAATA